MSSTRPGLSGETAFGEDTEHDWRIGQPTRNRLERAGSLRKKFPSWRGNAVGAQRPLPLRRRYSPVHRSEFCT